MKVKLQLINLKTLQLFEKEFETEFERDKFRKKLKYQIIIQYPYHFQL